jgi:hypothetical protein
LVVKRRKQCFQVYKQTLIIYLDFFYVLVNNEEFDFMNILHLFLVSDWFLHLEVFIDSMYMLLNHLLAFLQARKKILSTIINLFQYNRAHVCYYGASILIDP